jgi:hypothetical protein
MRPINDAESELFGLAEVGVAHHDRDGASSNNRLLAKRLSDLPSNVLGSDTKCGNHRTHLGDVAISHANGLKTTSSLYSLALFFCGLAGTLRGSCVRCRRW